jgi:hypothetical protein
MIDMEKVPLWPEIAILPWIEVERVDMEPYRMTRIVTRTEDGQLHSTAISVYDYDMKKNPEPEKLANLIEARMEVGMICLKDHVENWLAPKA